MKHQSKFLPGDRVIYNGKWQCVIVEALIDRTGGTGRTIYTIETAGGNIVRRVDEGSLVHVDGRLEL